MIPQRDLFAVIHLMAVRKDRKYTVKRAIIDFDRYNMCTTQHGLIAAFTRLSRDGLIEQTDGTLSFFGPEKGDDILILIGQFALTIQGKLFSRMLDMLVLATSDPPPAWAPIGSPMLSWRSLPLSMRTIAEKTYKDIRALSSTKSDRHPSPVVHPSPKVVPSAETFLPRKPYPPRSGHSSPMHEDTTHESNALPLHIHGRATILKRRISRSGRVPPRQVSMSFLRRHSNDLHT